MATSSLQRGRNVGRRQERGDAAAPGVFDRASALEHLVGAGADFDVVVVGGGITGAGVALDAASRGLRTALVEKQDFASGTSSKSSKLVHGGIRYLQQRELALVYESLAERQRLLDNASHLVAPLPFLIPLFGRNGVVSRAVARSYSSALWIYDLTGGVRIGRRHRKVGRAEALQHLPTFRADRLVAGFLYFDAQADDARLTLAVLRTAVLRFGAVAANYLMATGFTTDDAGRVSGVEVVSNDPQRPPTETSGGGCAARAPRSTIPCRVVVNAAGIWSDHVQALAPGNNRVALQPAKGIHVTVPRSRLPADIAAVIPVAADRRSVFVVPWPGTELVYVGTTDTRYDGSLDDPACSPADVAYLLDAVNAVTTSDLRPDDVLGVWAGLRPLLAPRDGISLSERTADLSRRHSVQASRAGVVTVTGGKLTTYRKMAADAVDAAVDLLGMPERRRTSTTKRLHLVGADAASEPGGRVPGSDPALSHLPAEARGHLLERYGTEAAAIAAVADGRPDLLAPVVEGLPYLGAEIVYAARSEMARCVEDVLSRRTRASIQDARATMTAAPVAARLLADELGWDEPSTDADVQRFTASIVRDLERAGLTPVAAGPER